MQRGRRLLVWATLLLFVGVLLVGCSSKPTAKEELVRFKTEYRKIEADISLMDDSFQSHMVARDMTQLHQMELKAQAMGREWEKLKFSTPEVDELHFEVAMALQGIGAGYGLGYIRVLRGDRDEQSLNQAIDVSIEGTQHLVTMYEKMRAVQANLPK